MAESRLKTSSGYQRVSWRWSVNVMLLLRVIIVKSLQLLILSGEKWGYNYCQAILKVLLAGIFVYIRIYSIIYKSIICNNWNLVCVVYYIGNF